MTDQVPPRPDQLGRWAQRRGRVEAAARVGQKRLAAYREARHERRVAKDVAKEDKRAQHEHDQAAAAAVKDEAKEDKRAKHERDRAAAAAAKEARKEGRAVKGEARRHRLNDRRESLE